MKVTNARFAGKRYVYPDGKPCLVENLDASQYELTATPEGLLAREPGADAGVLVPWHWVEQLVVDGLNEISTDCVTPAPAGPARSESSSAKIVPPVSPPLPVGGKRGGARR